MPIIIFDIDGTLANLSHRLHHIKNGNRNWKAFNESVHLDTPIRQMMDLLKTLHHNYYDIILVSGRGEEVRVATEQWMANHNVNYHALYMRKAGDYRKDTIIKKEILEQIRDSWVDSEGNSQEIAFVIDDRTSVVKMWRDNGLICLQCAEWEEEAPIKIAKRGLLTLLIGPSGAGKSTFALSETAMMDYGIHFGNIISSDQLRHDLMGDFRDQSKNPQVFAALHAIAKARIENGLDTVIDATNIKRADRMSIINHTSPTNIRYIVIDRPLEQKRATAGWRAEIPNLDLVGKHHQSFQSQLKDILKGDDLPNVEVINLIQHPSNS